MWFLFALMAAVSWGVGQVFVKRGFSHVSPLLNNVLSTVFALLLYIPFALMHGINVQLFWSIFPVVMVISIAYFLYYYVLNKGKVALTGTILALYPLTTIVLSSVFLHEQTNIVQKIATAGILLGAVCIAVPSDKRVLKKFRLDDWVWWAIAGALIIGSADFGAKVMINRSDAYTYLFALGLAYVPIAIGNFILDPKGRKLPRVPWGKLLPTLIGTFMIELGIIPFNLSFQYGLASLAGPVSSSYIVITAVLAYFFLHERITRLQTIGIAVAAAGTIALGIA